MNEKDFAYSEQGLAPQPPFIANASENAGIVDSLLHPLAILIRQVLTRSGRSELKMILIDDEENILEALHAGVEIHSLYYSGDEMLSNELLRNLPSNIKIYEVAKRTCKKLFENDKISRVFAIGWTPKTLRLGELLGMPGDIVALEDLTISGNIGAIVRTAVAFGVGGIVLLNAEPVDIYDRRVIRASRGHIFSVPVATATTEELIRFCQQKGLPMFAMAAQAGRPAQEAVCASERLVIIFGSEKDGCSAAVRESATLQVQIPTNSRVESLNVSTAAGIMLYNRIWFNVPELRK